MSDDDFTPTDRPIMLSDLNAIRKAVHNTESHTLAMYSEFQSFRGRIRSAVAVCIACAFVCLVSTVVTITSVASAAP